MLDRQRLADHAAHGSADNVCRVDAEVVEQSHRVVGHVGQQIGGFDEAPRQQALHHLAIGRDRRVDVRREPHVAVVEADHLEAASDEPLDELQRPGHELSAESHHKEQRFAFSKYLVLDGDPVRLRRSHVCTLGGVAKCEPGV